MDERQWRLHDMEVDTVVSGKPGREVATCNNSFGHQRRNAELIVEMAQFVEDCASGRLSASGIIITAQGLRERMHRAAFEDVATYP